MKISDLLEAGSLPVYYFAYGMLTDPEIMGGIPLVGKAELPNFEFEMFMYANVKPSPRSKVYGTLWEVNREVISRLDQIEGYPTLYDRKMVPVISNGKRYEAFVYTLTPESRDELEGSEPSQSYINKLVRGYNNAGIPLEQLQRTLK